ncbi:MAG TPA: transaldolase family protein [Patescibacteria group bacterium]|nr:transaldolase family protein [Patescibacteria group bacterium]
MQKLTTKIFIDGGEVAETIRANEFFLAHFGYPLDGQTTNPSLIAKNLQAKMEQEGNAGKLTPELAIEEYKKIVRAISSLLPHGSVSIQVFANKETPADEMLTQARERITWIQNASIKIPCTLEGLKAAVIVCKEMPINITLVFSQAQAAAVYEATREAKYPVFLSPFVGRLDDRGESGMDVVANMLRLYKPGDNHVEVLTASVRNVDHILYAFKLHSPIMTLPYKTFLLWQEAGFPLPDSEYTYDPKSLTPIPYDETIVLGKNWQDYNISHELTDKGLAAFWSDWTSLFSS